MTDDDRQQVRVLRVITRLNIGGPSIQAAALSDRLRSHGFETRLVHGHLDAGEGDMSYLLRPGTDAVRLSSLHRPIAPIADAASVLRLAAMIRAWHPQIVHTHMAKAGAVARIAAVIANRNAPRSRRARTVHTYHGHVLEGYFSAATTRFFVGVERQLARITDRIVAISPQIKTELLTQYRIGRDEQYRVVPLGFDLGPFARIDAADRQRARADLGLAADAHVVVTVGRLAPIKDHGLLLGVARRVADRDPAAHVLICGDGELRGELEAQTAALGLRDRVRFLGWRRDLTTIYAAADVFLLTSRNEGTPVALIESLASGVPGVSTDVGGVRDVIGGDNVGLLAAPGDAAGLAGHVTALLADRARRLAMGSRGRDAVLARYGIDRLVADIAALYRELTE